MSKMAMLEKRSARLYGIFKKHVIYIFPSVHRKKSFLIEKMQINYFIRMMVKLNTFSNFLFENIKIIEIFIFNDFSLWKHSL